MSEPHHITHAHYHGIGFVAVNWAAAETLVMFCIAALLKIEEPQAIALFWHMGFNDRRDRLVNLVVLGEFLSEDEKKEFDCLITRLNAGYQLRNTVAHSVWSKSPKTPNAITPYSGVMRGGKTLKFSGINLQEEHFTPERLVAEGQKIARLAVDLAQFSARHLGYEPGIDLGSAAAEP